MAARGGPDFLIIGAQKCGTSALYDHIARHPQVMPANSKEVHFFDLNYGRGLDWYASQFPSRRGERLTGEATPYYLFHPLVPERVARAMPEVKLIVLLRHPADRAVSHYHHELRLGHETLLLVEALAAEEERLAGEADRLRADPAYTSFNHQHFSYRARGRYAEQLEAWLAWFDREQALILRTEDLARPETLRSVWTFLGLEPLDLGSLAMINAHDYEPPPAPLRLELDDYFRPHNQRLDRLLGRRFGWSRESPAAPATAPLIVTGMHRSGTSLVASFLQATGVNLGEQLLPADRHNRHGYFEDIDILELQRAMVAAACGGQEGGWPEWGWTPAEQLDRSRLDSYAEAARRLGQQRAAGGTPWGWKDPRTTLLLDFWDRLLGEARYVFVYRWPWEVEDSIRRLDAAVFRSHPDYPLRIWTFYNRCLLEFLEHQPERCLLVQSAAVVDEPAAFVNLLRTKLGPWLPAPSDKELTEDNLAAWARVTAARVVDHELLRRSSSPGEVEEKRRALPAETQAVLAALEHRADLRTAAAPADAERVLAGLRPPNRSVGATPRVSVILPCFNDGRYLPDAVASVQLCDAEEPLELVIVDDGSGDPFTRDVLAGLERRDYTVLRQPHRGLGAARNAGIARARGRYLLPLDADNLLRPAYARLAAAVLDRLPRTGVVYGDAAWFGERRGRWPMPEFDVERLARGNFIDACAVFRRELWEQCGGYAEQSVSGFEDWDLWLAAAERGWGFHHLPKVVFDYRMRSDSMRTGMDPLALRHRVHRDIVARHRDFYLDRLPSLMTDLHRALVSRQTSGEPDAGEGLSGTAATLRFETQAGAIVNELDRLRRGRLARWRERLRPPRDLRDDVSPVFRQLLEDSARYTRDLHRYRLGPGANLQRVSECSYTVHLSRPNLHGVLLAPILDLPLRGGVLGLELIAAATGAVVARSTVRAAEIDERIPTCLLFPPVAESDRGSLRLRIFARDLAYPLRLFEWRRYQLGGFGALQTRPFCGFLFR